MPHDGRMNVPWWFSLVTLLLGSVLTYFVQARRDAVAHRRATELRDAEWARQDAREEREVAERERDRLAERLHDQTLADRDHLLAGLQVVHEAVSASAKRVSYGSVVEDPDATNHDRKMYLEGVEEWAEAQRRLRTFAVVAETIDPQVAACVSAVRVQLLEETEEAITGAVPLRRACDEAVIAWIVRQKLRPAGAAAGPTEHRGTIPAQTAPNETQ